MTQRLSIRPTHPQARVAYSLIRRTLDTFDGREYHGFTRSEWQALERFAADLGQALKVPTQEKQ